MAEYAATGLPPACLAGPDHDPHEEDTTHLSFEPTELLARLAALIPRPRKNLALYRGVFAANAKRRPHAVAFGRPEPLSTRSPAVVASSRKLAPRNPAWADLMRCGLDIDALECAVLRPAAIRRILNRLGFPAKRIIPAPARAPPDPDSLHDLDVA